MYDTVSVFKLSSALMAHSTQRQSLIAQNIAQADTPGYRAKDMQGFAETVARVAGSEPMRATRQNHVQTAMGGEQGGEIIFDDSFVSPNGNSVSLEREMMKTAQADKDYNSAISIYHSTMNMFRQAMGRR